MIGDFCSRVRVPRDADLAFADRDLSRLGACSGGLPDPKPNRPESLRLTNDPAFTTSRASTSWYLIGDGATPGEDQLTAIITAPSGTDFVDAYIPGLPPHADERAGRRVRDGCRRSRRSPAGAHDVLFSANGSDDAFAHAHVQSQRCVLRAGVDGLRLFGSGQYRRSCTWNDCIPITRSW